MDVSATVVEACLRNASNLTPLDVAHLSATCKLFAHLGLELLYQAEAAADRLLACAAALPHAPRIYASKTSANQRWSVPTRKQLDKQHEQRQLGLEALAAQYAAARTTIGPLVAAVLVSTPNVPMESAKALVAAGLRTNYPLLLGAANSNIERFEVWVLAHQRLGVPTGLPPLVEYVCSCRVCGGGLELPKVHDALQRLEHLTPSELADLLFLGLSMDPWHTCETSHGKCPHSKNYHYVWPHVRGRYLDPAQHCWFVACREKPSLFQDVIDQVLKQPGASSAFEKLSTAAIGELLCRILRNAASLGVLEDIKVRRMREPFFHQFIGDNPPVRFWRDCINTVGPRFVGDSLLEPLCKLPATAKLPQDTTKHLLESAMGVAGVPLGGYSPLCYYDSKECRRHSLPIDIAYVFDQHLPTAQLQPSAIACKILRAVRYGDQQLALRLCGEAWLRGDLGKLAAWQVLSLIEAVPSEWGHFAAKFVAALTAPDTRSLDSFDDVDIESLDWRDHHAYLKYLMDEENAVSLDKLYYDDVDSCVDCVDFWLQPELWVDWEWLLNWQQL